MPPWKEFELVETSLSDVGILDSLMIAIADSSGQDKGSFEVQIVQGTLLWVKD